MQEEHIEAFQHALEQRQQLLHSIDRQGVPSKGNPAAEWRLRKKRSQAIDSRLSEIGSFARLACGSLLVGLRSNLEIDVPVRYTNWRTTLENSLPFIELNLVEKGQVIGAPHGSYTRLESAIQSLGSMICLSVRDMEDSKLLISFWKLKLYCIRKAFPSEATCDRIIEYLKWLGKTAQAIFLRAKCPEAPLQPVKVDGVLAPFDGSLRFISDFYLAGKRNRKFTMAEARACAQISNLSRALPYPSTDQVKASIERSVKTFTSNIGADAQALKQYRKGLQAEMTSLGKLNSTKTHVSMVSSGVLENSRSMGGRSKVLISAARRFTDLKLDFESIKPLIDKTDQFGKRILRSETVELAKVLLERGEFSRVPTLGDILYLKVNDIANHWATALQGRCVPRELGNILNLTASQLLTEVGKYEPEPSWTLGIMHFEGVIPKFTLQGELRVRAGVSVESGLKARLTTSGSAAFAHLSQLPSNLLRGHLSKDPFMKVGFEEPEKFWEVLKMYANTFKL